jgi:hypothetical protein
VSTTIVNPVVAESVHKQLEAPGDCQDACGKNPERGRYAIADGVTRSFFPDEWAKLLVEHFCYDGIDSNVKLFETKDWQKWLAGIQPKWLDKVQARVKDHTGLVHGHLHNSLAAREPAASTFVGVEFDTEHGEAQWQALIVGDSCLLMCHGGHIKSFPIEHSADFNHHPGHFGSYPAADNSCDATFHGGTIEPGDVMILATDAMAKWLIGQYERDQGQWPTLLTKLRQLERWRDLWQFVEEKRNDRQCPLDDDDTTLIVLQATAGQGKRNPYWSPPTTPHTPTATGDLPVMHDSSAKPIGPGALGDLPTAELNNPTAKPSHQWPWKMTICVAIVATVGWLALVAFLVMQWFEEP